MSLDRLQLLEEMGLGTPWALRTTPIARSDNHPVPATQLSSAIESLEQADSEVSSAENAAESAEHRQASAFVAQATPQRLAEIAEMDWAAFHPSISACRACGLCEQRKQAVPGVGDPNADWLFIGEGPGAEEDARGEPFVGQAGKLLDAMLAAIDLERGSGVYISNAVKCRPPGNRTPEAAELAACLPYLERQIALIEPKLIVLLGRVAVHALLGEEGSLASLRGKPLSYQCKPSGGRTIPVVVTYHPAYLLRSLPDKSKSWEDLCRARSLMRDMN